MSSIVYKQSYKSRASPGVAGLNVRHLQYIATRPGTIYNKGCGFGLWGQLPGDDAIRIQSDLNLAKHIVRAASADHTLYRAIVSVGQQDAEAHGLYHRENWEHLVNDRIGSIAKEMDIKPENFCWLASMHCARGHPHVHLIYWDNSNQPRPESYSKDIFKRKAERIRSEFARDIYREEILETQQDQRTQAKSLRTALRAMCLEANPEKAVDLPRLYNSSWLKGASQQMAELIRQLPAKGSLRYAYLPADYKVLVNKFITTCLMQPELAKEAGRYDIYTQRISELYANGPEHQAQYIAHAREKLYKELGNEVMVSIRSIRAEIQGDCPESRSSARELIQEAVSNIVPNLDAYHQLRSLLPPERIPLYRMEHQIPGYHDQMNKVVGEVLQDARVRLRLQKYALEMSGVDLSQKPDATRPDSDTTTERPVHILEGKVLSEDEWESYQDIYREAKRDLRAEITERLRQDAGWTEEAIHTGTAMAVCGLMCVLSRMANQKRANCSQAAAKKLISKDKSRDAKKDAQQRHSLTSEWGDDF